MIKLLGYKADAVIRELELPLGESTVPMDVVFRRVSVEGRSVLVIHFKKMSQIRCDRCGKELTSEELSNHIHYPHERVCDICMDASGLFVKEEKRD